MKSPLRFVFLVVFLVSGFSMHAQSLVQVVKGRVVDQGSQASIPGANILILDTDPVLGASSDDDGYFRIPAVPVGRYNIQCSFLGYETVVLREVLVGSGKEVVLTIELKEIVTSLRTIEISASNTKGDALNQMSSVSSRQINMEEANRYAGGGDDPSRLASSFAGVASGLASNGIVIRGNAPKGLLWRLEDVEISNPNHFANMVTFGGGGLTALSSQVMANSDFLTGAFPAEYSNALSGVFDMRLRTANVDKREHTFQLGSNGIDFASEGPFVKGKRSTYLFNYRFSTLTLLQPILPPEAGALSYQDLAFKLNFPTKKLGVISLWGLMAYDAQKHKADHDSLNWTDDVARKYYSSKLFMGALGINHRAQVNKSAYLSSVLAFSGNGVYWDEAYLNNQLIEIPSTDISSLTGQLTLRSYVNYKISARHINRTGFNLSRMFYDMNIMGAATNGDPLSTFAMGNGSSTLVSMFSQSKYEFGPKTSVVLGLNWQYFALNQENILEPRASFEWKISARHAISLAYGLHSRIEMLSVYLAQQTHGSGISFPNQNLEISKAHHFVLSYHGRLNEQLSLRIEPYVQLLYDIPVVPANSQSLINLESSWFFNDSLINSGTGRNIGIDLTLERYLSKGFYFMITASLFESHYMGGDGVERNTRFNKQYVANVLGGKEWSLGKQKNNLLSINARLCLLGGDRMEYVDFAASNLAQAIVFDDSKAFSVQKPASQVLSFSINYRRNKHHHASIWSFQIINALAQKEFEGYAWDSQTQSIVKQEDPFIIPAIAYRIEF